MKCPKTRLGLFVVVALSCACVSVSLEQQLRWGTPTMHTGRNLPKVPVDPPQLEKDEKEKPMSVVDYEIPNYPLPPLPTASPPSTMPFANVDFSTINGFTPPSSEINSMETKGNTPTRGRASGVVGDKPYNTTVTSPDNIAFEAPPLTADVGNNPIFPGLGTNFDALLLRKDSTNPYCEFCKSYMQQLNNAEKSDNVVIEACRPLPFGNHKHCHQALAPFPSIKMFDRIAKLGCVDRTSGMARIREKCPPLVACNIVPSKSGAPMCGTVLRGWGTLPRPESNPGSGSGSGSGSGMLTELPEETVAETVNPRFAAPPVMGAMIGSTNQYCDVCRSIVSVLAVGGKTGIPASEACKTVPLSQVTGCEAVQSLIQRSHIVQTALASGCIDKTLTGPLLGEPQRPKCPPAITCNLISDVSGSPICGGVLEQYGQLKKNEEAK